MREVNKGRQTGPPTVLEQLEEAITGAVDESNVGTHHLHNIAHAVAIYYGIKKSIEKKEVTE